MIGTIGELLERAAARWPDKTAVVSSDRSVTYRRLAEEVERAAGWLAELGVVRGDRVVLALPSSIELLTLASAAARLGGIFVILSDEIRDYELARILADAEPRVLVLPPGRAPAAAATAFTVVTPEGAPGPARGTLNGAFPGISSDPACLIYTSGSTAAPKGVVSTHRSMRFVTAAIQRRLELRHDDVIGVFLPLSFDYGLYQYFLAAQVGATLALGRSSHVGPGLAARLREWRVSVLPVVPHLAAMLVRLARRLEAPPELRMITSTGAYFAPALVDDLRTVFPECAVYVMFGLTECKRVSILTPAEFESRRQSVGRPLDDTECVVVDETGSPVPPGVVGEIVVRGPHVMSGYWRAREATDERFRPWGSGLERALFTGDYGRTDEEGYLYFSGRRDDVYKSRGFRVSAVEVEVAALDIPGVAEAALVPPLDGRGPRLFVSGGVGRAEVVAGLHERLEPHKVPDEVAVLDAMPLTSNGKIDKRTLGGLP